MKITGSILIVLATLFFVGCTKEDTAEEGGLISGEGSSIVGQWFLTAIGDTDVSQIECYRDSYLDANSRELTFFIQDRQEDGSCVTVLSETLSYTEDEGFYYIEDEALEIYIEGKELTWRVDLETTLVFEKN